jgi:UDP-N-acetyl-D-glucosamine dehydrogenase
VLAAHLRPGATVVLESTTYPGTTEELLAPLLEKGSGLAAGPDFHLGYSPERIDPGNPVWRLENTLVSGWLPLNRWQVQDVL